MSKYVIDDSTLSAIGDAVREKDGTTDKILVSDLATRILAIEGGGTGEGYEPPAEALVLTGDCKYRFYNGGFDWVIDDFGDKITTSNITNIEYMFNKSNVSKIPFEINLGTSIGNSASNVFSNCNYLEAVPIIKGNLSAPTGNYSNNPSFTSMFSNCLRLREIPIDFFNNFLSEEFYEAAINYTGTRTNLFSNCYSLRKYPDIHRLKSSATTYSALYYNLFTNCICLDEIKDLVVLNNLTHTSNIFNSTFSSVGRVKSITFETNEDGTPLVANWKSQVISLNSGIGYTNNENWLLDYSGITEATEITDDTSYQALKDNVDCWTRLAEYSRYNHDCAVETINSLPDTSAYLSTAGGTNTIKFYGRAGERTDGGAINTLTEEEVAVAIAKGWTVTLS